MRKQSKTILISICVIIVFFARLYWGLSPTAPTPGLIPSGAMNDPLAVIASALLLSGLTWAFLAFLFWFFSKIKSDS